MPSAQSRSFRTPAPSVDLDELSAHWRRAFNSAQDALTAGSHYLTPDERRLQPLTDERMRTAKLLDEVAREHRVRLLHRVTAPRPTPRMLGLRSDVAGCIFELEGVLAPGAALHAAAWSETFDELLLRRPDFVPFNPRVDYRAYIQGRPRLDGVRAFLASRGLRLPEETVRALASHKNEVLQRLLAAGPVNAYDGSKHYLEAVRDAGIPSAVVSASEHTQEMLERAGLARLVDKRVDGRVIVAEHLKAWPKPDVLLEAAHRLGVAPEHTAVFETEAFGVTAGRAGGFEQVVAVERHGGGEAMRRLGADIVVADLEELLDRSLR